MKWYRFKPVLDSSGAAITSTNFPKSTHRWWVSIDDYIYMVDSVDDTLLLKSTDKGDSWSTVRDDATSYERVYYNPSSEIAYLFMSDGEMDKIDCSDDTYTASYRSPLNTPNVIYDVTFEDHAFYLYEDVGDAKLVYMNFSAAPVTEGVENMGTVGVRTYKMSQCAWDTGDEFPWVYFLWKWSDENVELWKCRAGVFTQLKDCGSNTDIPAENQWGIAYDNDDIVFFVLKDTSDSKFYFYTYVISTNTLTKGYEANINFMLDRNNSGTLPNDQEKAFHTSSYYVYKIRPRRTGFYKLGEVSTDAAIIAISDTYLINSDGDMFEYIDDSDSIDSCVISYKMGDVTMCSFLSIRELANDDYVIFHDDNELVIFEGRIMKKTRIGTKFSYNCIGVDMEMYTYKFSYDATAGVNAKTAIEAVLDNAKWLYYDSSITDPAISIKGDFKNIPFKDFMDYCADRCDYVWYVAPDGKVYFNAGTTASGDTVDKDNYIFSPPKITDISTKINKVILYGGYGVDGVRITSTSEDTESQTLYGVTEYIDHFPNITNQTELDTLATQIRTRSGMNTSPKYIFVDLFNLDFVQCGTTINFAFSPYSYVASDDILLSYIFDAKRNIMLKSTLSTGLVQTQRQVGVSYLKTSPSDEEQIDMLGAAFTTGITASGDWTLKTGGDTDDYLVFGTSSDVPEIDIVGSTELLIKTDNTERVGINSSGIILDNAGARINEFSTDGTLGDNSDTAVPTEKAVKTYVDGAAGGGESLDETFDIGKTIDGADSEANAMQVGDATDKMKFWSASNVSYIETSDANTITIDSDSVLNLYADSHINLLPDGETDDYVAFNSTGTNPYMTIQGGGVFLLKDSRVTSSYEDVCLIETGTYTGTDANNRNISVGFTPKAVLITSDSGGSAWYTWFKHESMGLWEAARLGTEAQYDNAIKLESGGFEVNNGDAADHCNDTGDTYFWIAWA